jgi:hypothetical protein
MLRARCDCDSPVGCPRLDQCPREAELVTGGVLVVGVLAPARWRSVIFLMASVDRSQ